MASRYRALDTALIQTRRLFDVPPMVDDDGHRVEASTVLVLEALDKLGEPATIKNLAMWLAVSHSTASRLVSRAVTSGAVSRAPSPADRREQILAATPAGRRLAIRAQAFRQARLAELLADWTDDDITVLARLMTRLGRASTSRGGAHSDVKQPPRE